MAMMNHKRLSVPRLLTPIALAITLAACSSSPQAPVSVDITLDPSQSTQNYMMQADSSQGSLQNDWLIMALKAAIQSGSTDQATLLIKRLAKQQLSEIQQAEWQLSRAQLLFNNDQPEEAYKQLNFQAWWKLPSEQWKDYYSLRSDMLEVMSQYFSASRELVLLSDYVETAEQELIANRIWQNLSAYSQYEITELETNKNEEVLDGWLQLAIYMKTLNSNVPQLKNTLEHWLEENSNHPAALYTPIEISDILKLDISKPTSTALLLPLTGKFGKQAQLVRDGFIFAMMNDTEREQDATLTVLDTNTQSAEAIKAKLIEDNVDFIVGPLIKGNITKLQQAQTGKVDAIPALALNIPNEIVDGTNMCYLALSPEQEVAQAAKHLFTQGYKYPLILAPKGRLGERVKEAFEQEWQKYSSNEVAMSSFADKRQLQRNINQVFGLQESQQRIAQMDALLNLQIETEPRSRRDIDSVYIVAKNSELTLIKPFIEVAINPDAKQPALFSNSRSNSGDKQYEDLTGVIYSDIPLLIEEQSAVNSQLNELWPNNSHAKKRLQALGMDAYSLMEALPQMKVIDGYSISGETGVLTIDNQCIIQRQISWAEHGAI
ncbi:penicillin-binding protein activator [Vibrio gallaecicus]|uniref:Penicillin-binding protein activator LpoA n=1 Tax=Vibrio gallaecicus TaxID=552386 RepID=A0ABV4N5W6_9VIBR|nr:penicillin-binding protein activator [Vibrio gallaecicus]MDN3614062.1 penicillin-binding protein activator [Vibrio gallaecicus]